MPFPLTKEQREIVEDRGGELLVSAAAGSGKTRVLVERLLDRVSREGTDIDRFLVITYTKAAAAELRARIAQELSECLAQHPQDRHLRYQTTLVYQAQISTIHSFCSQMLRECGHQLDLDSDFRLADEGEAAVLMGQTLEGLLELRYESLGRDDPFFQLVLISDGAAVLAPEQFKKIFHSKKADTPEKKVRAVVEHSLEMSVSGRNDDITAAFVRLKRS